jgi:iron complex outermembrane recepter protein
MYNEHSRGAPAKRSSRLRAIVANSLRELPLTGLLVSLVPAAGVLAAESPGAPAGAPVVAMAAVAAADQATGPEAPAPAAAEPAVSEVVVTGSRIPQPNMTSTSPIQVVTSQEIKQTGTTDISTLINTLPQQFQNSVADFSNTTNPLTSAGGLSTADLRGLGPQRTLVLVDGRRLGVGDASTLNPNPAPDLDQIPAPLVERIDVVTGGASAVYGSDAVAGVVNFIMKHNFQGLQIDGQYGIDQHDNHNSLMQGLEKAADFNAPNGSVWNGQNREVSIIAGTNLEGNKGNVTGYFVYYNANPVSQGSRDFSGCLMHVGTSTNPNIIDTPFCDGSPNSNLYAPSFNAFGAAYSVVGHQLLPYPQAGSVPPPLFNSSPYQYLSRGDTRYTAGFSSHYDINDYIRPYVDFNYMNDRSQVQIGPGALFFGSNPFNPSGTGGWLVNCTPANPLLSPQEVATLCQSANFAGATDLNNVDVLIGRRDIEGGPRQSYYEHNNWRAVFGVKGDFADAWSYDAYGSDYYTSLFQNNTGYLSATKAQNALLVVTDPKTGKPVCEGGQAGCVPYNIWTQGAITQDQLAYLLTNGSNYGTVNERILDASITGDLGKYGVKSPVANEGIAVVGGWEHRNETLDYAPDQAELSNDLSGFSGAGVAVNGSYHVSEGFFEARVPLVQQKPFFEDLVFHTAYRRSDYSTGAGNVNTYAFDLQWAPTPDFRLRGSFQRAIRAPNVIELFTPQSVTNTSVVSADPCAGAAPTASLAECEHTGVKQAQYGHILQCPAGQCATLEGGNPDLQAEVANTLSYGATFTPTFLTGFSASVDYYHIILRQEIGIVPLTTTLQECLTTGNPTFCQNIVRTSIGTLFGTTIVNGGWISGTNVNTAVGTVEGVDVQMAYRYDIGKLGTLSTTLAGTYLSRAESQPTAASLRYDCATLYGPTCQTVNPRWRHNLRVNWDTPLHVLLSAQWRFIGAVTLDHNTQNPELIDNSAPYGPGVIDETFDKRLASVSYLDLSAIWTINHTLTLRAGCNNVLDRDPPLVAAQLSATGSPNTYPTYDLLGRQMYVALTATF